MAYGFFVADVVSTLVVSGGLLFNYGNWKSHNVLVTLAVLISWYFSFLIVVVLPLDVSSTAYKQCLNVSVYNILVVEEGVGSGNSTSTKESSVAQCLPPPSLLAPNILPNLWRLVYWSCQALTWLILPMMKGFTQAGEFTFSGKLKSSLRDNAIYYSSYLLIAFVLLVYILAKPDLHLNWDRLKAIAASASNTWGLFVLVLMLGHGLVEVPRTLWNRSHKGYQLKHAYFKIAKLMSEKLDEEETLDDVLASLLAVSDKISSSSDPRRPMMDIILKKVPVELLERARRRGRLNEVGEIDDKSLVKLHGRLIRALQAHKRAEAQWNDWTYHVFELEDVNRNMVSNDHIFIHYSDNFVTGVSRKSKFARLISSPKIEWYWKCLLVPLLLKVGAVVAAVMSLLTIWSEVTFFSIQPTLSVFAAVVKSASASQSYLIMEIICLCTLFYLCLCSYYTVFKIRILNYYYLAPKHHSDEYTLLFSGALLCRLTPPLCLNFLSLIHMDSHVIASPIMETAYTQIMGHMDVISIVSDYFNVYFPIALLVLTLSTYFSLGARLLSAFGFQQFLNQDSDLTQEVVEEGREHMKMEKRRRQRLVESAARRGEFSGRLSGNGDREPGRRTDFHDRRRKTTSHSRRSSPELLLLRQDWHGEDEEDRVAQRIVEKEFSLETHDRGGASEPPRNIFDDV